MAITAETRNDIIELVVTAYNAAPGTTLLTELVAIVDGGGTLADVAASLTTSARWTSLYPSFQTAEEFAAEWLGALVPEAEADALAEGISVAVGLINGGASFADLILEAQGFLSATDETDASFGTSAANFNNKVEVATNHTVTLEKDGTDGELASVLESVTSDDATVTAANEEQATSGSSSDSFNLTTATDVISGTANDDIFSGIVGTNAANGNLADTAQNVDTVSGGAGNDVLNIETQAGGTLGLTVADVERINYKVFTAQIFNAVNTSGLTSLNNDGSIANLTVNNLAGIVDLYFTGVSGNETDITYSSGTTGSTDVQKIFLNGATNDHTIDLSNGIESLEITSMGSVTNRVDIDDINDVTSITITGDAGFNFGVEAGSITGLKTVDASGAGGSQTLNLSTNVAASNMTVTGSAQNDTVVFGNLN